MELFVNRVVEIEKQAVMIVEQATRIKDGLEDEINKKKQELESSILSGVSKKIQELKAIEVERADKKCREFEDRTNEAIAKMNETYSQRKAEWEEELFNKLILEKAE